MTLVLGVPLADTDGFEPQDVCVDPSPYTSELDWTTAFEFTGGMR